MTPEERISTLEQNFLHLKEGIERVEKTLEKLNDTFTQFSEKLDARYPSKETVDLRFKDTNDELDKVKKEVGDLKGQIDAIKKWMYKVMGGVAVVAFLIGLIAQGYHFWR